MENEVRRGKLYFRYGAMGCSKSAQLLIQAHGFEERGIPFLCMKSCVDTRDGEDTIASRAGMSRECVTVSKTDDIFEMMRMYCEKMLMQGLDTPAWVLVDEAQFLSEAQVDQLAQVADDMGIDVMCYGLRTDFRTKFFEGSRRLMEIADTIDEIKMSCRCGGKATVNARVAPDGMLLIDGEQVVIGGNEMYVPMCRRCYRRMRREAERRMGITAG